MAGIDKTYTDSYDDYKEFKTWADKQTLTFFNGHKVCVGNWVWEYEKEDFDGGEIPIMNTPTWLDIYLIQNCKSDFVLDRMKSVYDEESYKEFQCIDLTAKPSVLTATCDDNVLPVVIFYMDDGRSIEYIGYNDDFIDELNRTWNEDNDQQLELTAFGGFIFDSGEIFPCKNYHLSFSKIDEWDFP